MDWLYHSLKLHLPGVSLWEFGMSFPDSLAIVLVFPTPLFPTRSILYFTSSAVIFAGKTGLSKIPAIKYTFTKIIERMVFLIKNMDCYNMVIWIFQICVEIHSQVLVKGLNGDDRHTLHVCPLSSRRVIIEFFLVYVTETFLISLILLHVQYTPTRTRNIYLWWYYPTDQAFDVQSTVVSLIGDSYDSYPRFDFMIWVGGEISTANVMFVTRGSESEKSRLL